MKTYTLTVRQISDPTYREVISVESSRDQAERTERGVLINLNYDDFYTYIEEADVEPEPITVGQFLDGLAAGGGTNMVDDR